MKPRLPRLSLFLLSQCLTLAANAAAISCPDKPIKLAFYHYGLLYFESPAGQARGIDRDLVDVLTQRSGCKFQTVVQTRARIWMDLEAGWLD
ncbi:MAG: ABC transporter substrate-binding protein, partial [Burkholderiaceae bacterium]|nr:ABC transporter substrate-binding protein [Burkholderiaceae bacterium]